MLGGIMKQPRCRRLIALYNQMKMNCTTTNLEGYKIIKYTNKQVSCHAWGIVSSMGLDF